MTCLNCYYRDKPRYNSPCSMCREDTSFWSPISDTDETRGDYVEFMSCKNCYYGDKPACSYPCNQCREDTSFWSPKEES